LAARARKAQERKAEQQPSSSRGIESGTAARGFERMEEKILEWEASGQLSGSGSGTSPAAGTDAGIPSPAVNAELERLKQQLSARHS
ncbi:MAG: PspA/IM30 family protein, partial [Paenibacillus macerans]|nr:PspA/IM30 family protein [Paenibacillus macerans]